MPDTSKFKTAHQLARDLLAGPDLMVVIPTPAFDMPGMFTAFPARAELIKVEGQNAIAVLADADALPGEKPEEPDATEVRHCSVCDKDVTPAMWATCSRKGECLAFYKAMPLVTQPDATAQNQSG